MRPAFVRDVKKKRKDIEAARIVKDMMAKKTFFMIDKFSLTLKEV